MREALQSCRSESGTELIRQVHALKGVSLNLCFARAGEPAVSLESLLRDGSTAAERDSALSRSLPAR